MSKTHPIAEVFSELDEPFTGEALFDQLRDIVFFIKNVEGRYVVVNQTLVERFSLKNKTDVIGRTPSELLPAPFGRSFEAQDRRVLESGTPLVSQLELHFYPSRDRGWCLTQKIPLKTKRGRVTGLVGISQDLRLPDLSSNEFQCVARAVEFAEANLASSPKIDQLAKVAGMSPYRLDRRMQRVFGLTTGQWVLKTRIDSARQDLLQTPKSIAMVALDAGYSDQSAFTRQFRQATGMSPTSYRNASSSSSETSQ